MILPVGEKNIFDMKRIGIAASKMAKGNLVLYNLYVVLLSSLFSLFIFIVAGSTILFALILLGYIGDQLTSFAFSEKWDTVLSASMACLTIVITVFTVLLLSNNLKFKIRKRGNNHKNGF